MLRFLFIPMVLSLTPCLSSADTAAPAAVAPIDEAVAQADHVPAHWTTAVTDDSCAGSSCSKTTIWLDEKKTIRKMVTTASVTPAAAAESDKSDTESYLDADGKLICQVVTIEHFKGLMSESLHQERSYLENRKLIAWKTDDAWHPRSDPYWQQTEDELVSGVEAAVDQAHSDLKSPPKATATQ